MAYEGTQIGADGKRYKAGEAPSDEEARASTDQKTQAMQEQREKAKLNAASIGNREWGNATQNDSNADGPVREQAQPEADAEEEEAASEEEEVSPEDAEAAEKEANLAEVPEGSEFPYHKGGGWFTLSDGTTVQGKESADKAESELGG